MKILLLADVRGWAWDRNAQYIKKYLPQYDIDIGYINNGGLSLKFKDFKHVHGMGWLPVKHFSKTVSAGVCSHNHELRNQPWERYFPHYRALTVNSLFLKDQAEKYNNNVFYCPNGVDESLFVPSCNPRCGNFVVGWVGQLTVGQFNIDKCKDIDIKGYTNVLLPLVDRLKDKGVEFKIISNNYKNALSYDEMPKFYNDIDVQICTSFREGTPNPMFEAASCGKALISTRVGAITEFIEGSQGGILIDAYNSMDDIPKTIDAFESCILKLKEDRNQCYIMGQKNRLAIEKEWTWEIKAQCWIPLFEMFS